MTEIALNAYPRGLKPGKATRPRKLALLPVLLSLCLSSVATLAANVAFVDKAESPPESRIQAELAARFYGLKFTPLSVENGSPSLGWERVLGEKDTLAVIVTARALPFLSQAKLFSALSRGSNEGVPLMIVGVTGDIKGSFLRSWSADAILGCRDPTTVLSTAYLKIANLSGITRELAERALPFSGEIACSLVFNPERRTETIAEIEDGGSRHPVFVETSSTRQNIFVQVEMGNTVTLPAVNVPNLLTVFPQVAPLFMFIRYASGDRAWHRVSHNANLTIDDAWLTQPYGNLNFEELLAEMQRMNFHTTIAFIPWNFDRSKPNVVSLIRSHPDRFSIVVHGNNHDHQEFNAYSAKPLAGQIYDIKQALARMERFKDLTGIPYDRVMVWPHEVVPPVGTLAALKEHGFLANVNAQVIPISDKEPPDPLFPWHSGTLAFANFLTIERVPVSAPLLESRIAIDDFLGNPSLFYAHEDLFAGGSSAFNDIAALVNHIAPDTKWESLGDIVRSLYLVRKRDDGQYDVQIYSSQTRLDNPETSVRVFYVEKEESFSPLIKSLIVDGKPHSYRRLGNHLLFEVEVSAKQSVEVAIEYEDDLNLASIDISKTSLRVSALRRLSDFRDLWVSRSSMGRAFVRFYNNDLTSAESALEEHFTLIAAFSLLGFIFVLIKASRRPKKTNGEPEGAIIPPAAAKPAVGAPSKLRGDR